MPQGASFPQLFSGSYYTANQRLKRAGTQQPAEHKEGLFDKIFHHHHKQGEEGQGAKDAGQPESGEGDEGGIRSDLKKDEAGMKEYLKEDEQLEQEGRTYGGLM